ncbi:unnamed protein product [Angiostrongylus costaricensis]|uniref:Lipid droplet-associated serine hydrolase n=1 Tax=Angiostrongylus costaricensis TaxID=334426 RepID=A0A0R3PX33_ANGCS|nr:unnamed protein product [Angiostrongylus costaricensis]
MAVIGFQVEGKLAPAYQNTDEMQTVIGFAPLYLEAGHLDVSYGDVRPSEKSVCERGNSTNSAFVVSQFEERPARHSSSEWRTPWSTAAMMLLCKIGRCVDWVVVRGRWTIISLMSTDPSSESFCEMRDNIANRNPGNDGPYADFGLKLLRCLLSRDERVGYPKRYYLFHTVSHLNHVVLPDELRCSGKHSHCDRFKLDDQVQHKYDPAREHLPRAQKANVLGHSIGAYMMLRLLPYMKDDFNVKNAMGLFPTVEKMAESPNGVRLERVLAHD